MSRLYAANSVAKRASATNGGGFQKLSITNAIRINFEENKVFVESGKYYDEELAALLIENIKRYYKERGYTIL